MRGKIKMARPKINEEDRKIKVTVYLPIGVIEKLKALAAKQRLPLATLARIILLHRLDLEEKILPYEDTEN